MHNLPDGHLTTGAHSKLLARLIRVLQQPRRLAGRFEADRQQRKKLAARFLDALREGDVEGLQELLAADVQLVGDGGGKAPQFAMAIVGVGNVARVLASNFPWLVRIDVTLEPHQVNASRARSSATGTTRRSPPWPSTYSTGGSRRSAR
jgi:hypothetical protein